MLSCTISRLPWLFCAQYAVRGSLIRPRCRHKVILHSISLPPSEVALEVADRGRGAHCVGGQDNRAFPIRTCIG